MYNKLATMTHSQMQDYLAKARKQVVNTRAKIKEYLDAKQAECDFLENILSPILDKPLDECWDERLAAYDAYDALIAKRHRLSGIVKRMARKALDMDNEYTSRMLQGCGTELYISEFERVFAHWGC